MIEMSIESIRVSLMNYQRVVILKEKESDRYLPIWIGPAEADAIAVRLQDVSVARPLTHDLLRSIIDQLGATVAYIVVNDLTNDTVFARVILDVDGRSVEIDSRPSDAIALAVRARVPIFAEENVLEKAGVLLDENEKQAVEPEVSPEVREEELKKMSAFRDFIESLDLDDFDKRKGN
ncbi:MAG TPA: bifunctional nuclease family protein [Dehalococcoidia bacterium]|nr:bifunctional nuclease family protein [Dehalococcoidia bacterium]